MIKDADCERTSWSDSFSRNASLCICRHICVSPVTTAQYSFAQTIAVWLRPAPEGNMRLWTSYMSPRCAICRRPPAARCWQSGCWLLNDGLKFTLKLCKDSILSLHSRVAVVLTTLDNILCNVQYPVYMLCYGWDLHLQRHSPSPETARKAPRNPTAKSSSS